MLRCSRHRLSVGMQRRIVAGCITFILSLHSSNMQTLADSTRLRCLHDSGPAKALQSYLALNLRLTGDAALP